ncbi:FAD-binding domain-containing protein [Penicillium robsamsonii]|uniref:FAD-binding domain-containing protein n=1 Tax=Penicillium robsamsonii TaxID=1792511 RepID=UPI002548B903|nr:FAD-binding domain-containing protein [Penicillium robsamsonii]KAJ5811086.1 FAD-binding domain-containing protein [Penicillium robsamsonii]
MANPVYAIAAILCVLSSALAAPTNEKAQEATCRYLPGDAGWPTDAEWSNLNSTIGGRLIRGTPLAQRCYGSDYDPAACAALQEDWIETATYYDNPVNVMAPYWLNNSCSPFLGSLADAYATSNTPSVQAPSCSSGNIAVYAVDVNNAETVAKAFKFAAEKNIRLSIKNTGHDYIGRSNGQGSLALWTHNLKALSFFNYSSAEYTGPAAKAGAGVQFKDAYKLAADNGFRLTGGYCPTVGMVGGYVQGGGHGPLGASYGLAADNALEFEVVTTDGRHLVASKTKNSDLYWALSGGGGGNYALVLSLTIKAHVDGPVAGAALSFANTNSDSYWDAIGAFQRQILTWNQIPGLALSFGFDNTAFQLNMATWPGATKAEIDRTLSPFLQRLDTLHINATYIADVQDTFHGHFEEYGFPDEIYQTNSSLGGWLISPSMVQNNLTYILDSYKAIVTDPSTSVKRISAISGNLSHAHVGNKPGSNAVLEAWRDSLYTVNLAQGYAPDASVSELQAVQAKVNKWQDLFKPLGGGAYINEATYDDVDWKNDYFGANYDRLLQIKHKYDPKFALWQHTSVGADDYWELNGAGRLCRV